VERFQRVHGFEVGGPSNEEPAIPRVHSLAQIGMTPNSERAVLDHYHARHPVRDPDPGNARQG